MSAWACSPAPRRCRAHRSPADAEPVACLPRRARCGEVAQVRHGRQQAIKVLHVICLHARRAACSLVAAAVTRAWCAGGRTNVVWAATGSGVCQAAAQHLPVAGASRRAGPRQRCAAASCCRGGAQRLGVPIATASERLGASSLPLLSVSTLLAELALYTCMVSDWTRAASGCVPRPSGPRRRAGMPVSAGSAPHRSMASVQTSQDESGRIRTSQDESVRVSTARAH